jgi:nitrite reductase/ring-hydroxylating ferredoxin subunit
MSKEASMGDFVKVARRDEIAAGNGMTVDVSGTPVAIFNVDGKYCATHNTCLHRQGPLGEGELDGNTVTCPWHGWQYDVTTGQCLTAPGQKVQTFEVKVEGDDLLVRL